MITTKTGDQGQTTCGNQRVSKDDLLVETVGEIDELESVLEMVGVDKRVLDDLRKIMGELGYGTKYNLLNERVKQIEREVEKENISLEKFLNYWINSNFISTGKYLLKVIMHTTKKYKLLELKMFIFNLATGKVINILKNTMTLY